MHPDRDERLLSGSRPLLRDRSLTMSAYKVAVAAVDLVVRAKKMLGDRSVLDVPARPPGAKLALPKRLARLRKLPDAEVAAVPLLVACVDAGDPVFGLLHGPASELAVVRELCNVEID